MDNIFDAIRARRSVRKYLDKPLSKETIEELIELAKWAPSGMDQQPWGFIVVQDRALIKEISDRALPYIKKLIQEDPSLIRYKKRMDAVKDFSIFYHAPCLVIILGKKKSWSYEKDCAMAAQNMMLAARSMGIGSCWVGMMNVLERDAWFKGKFQIPEDYAIVGPIALGYFDEKDAPAVKRKPTEILKWF